MRPRYPGGRTALPAFAILMAIILIFVLPQAVSGATPPPGTEVTVSVSNTTVTQGTDEAVTVEWHRREASFVNAPEKMYITVYSIPDAGIVTRYAIFQDEGRPSESRNAGHYYGYLRSAELPAGRLMIVATDPLSGVSDWLPIVVSGQGALYRSDRSMKEAEGLFFGTTWICTILLGAALVLLTRRDAGR